MSIAASRRFVVGAIFALVALAGASAGIRAPCAPPEFRKINIELGRNGTVLTHVHGWPSCWG